MTCRFVYDILHDMKNLLLTATVLFALASCAAAEPVDPVAPNIPGFVPVTIKQGTNTVSNLPFTANLRPSVRDFRKARSGDTFVWKEGDKEVRYTFDGKAWSGNAVIPTHESFTIIRTANATDVWNIGGEVDLKKAAAESRK